VERLFSGSGPGAQTADGCSVELYRELPYAGELDPVESWFVRGTRVLELGCGAGRLTRRVLALGVAVTAIDNSTAMLAEAPDEARKVRADIESLQLQEQYSVVILASCLINHPVVSVRRAFLRTARRHLVKAGVLLVERQDPNWLERVAVGTQHASEDLIIDVESVHHLGQRRRIGLRYITSRGVWRQEFEAAILHRPELQALLASEGFTSHVWLGPNERWVASFAS
jgi:SAM-dependent methyltransferase